MKVKSSFRDPSGFMFKEGNVFYRQVNNYYKKDYELLKSSGLYDELVGTGMLISHKEVDKKPLTQEGWKIIKPETVPFISYFYEWSFSMLKDAALLTLAIQKLALKHGMSLKDASAFNIQFIKGRPILIDTLSFEEYEEGKPWVAYKQFVEHFLCTLAVMSYTDVRLGRMGEVFLNGIPVDLAAEILPFKAKLSPRLLFHIFAHASSQKKYSNKGLEKGKQDRKFSKNALFGLIENLEGSINALKWKPKGTEWEDYYEEDKNNYKEKSFVHKEELVKKYVTKAAAKTVWDMGANTGHFSKIAASTGAEVIAFDIDPGAIEKNYLNVRRDGAENILPLFSDLTNPTPPLGWELQERYSLFERGPADLVMALALIHHLAIPHNVPFSYLAKTFSEMGEYLIVEFIEKEDSQVQILLSSRVDIFDRYTKKDFEKEFAEHFKIVEATSIKDSKRTLYLMKRK